MQNNLRKLNRVKYLLILVICVVGIVTYWLLSRSFLKIDVVPVSATITVDNAPINLNAQGHGNTIVSLGKHIIKAEAEGYSGKVVEKTFWPGRFGTIKIELTESPTQTKIADYSSFLYPGKDANEILYLGNSGRTLFKTKLTLDGDGNPSGSTLAITDAKLSGINEIIWSPERDLALFRKTDGIYLFDFQKYDFINQTETLWGRNIGDIAWAPDNARIAYYNQTDKTIIFTDSGNLSPTRIVNLGYLGIENPLLRWSPDSEWLIVIPRNSNRSQNKIYLLNAYSRSLSEVTDTGNQLDAGFSANSQKIIYTSVTQSQTSAEQFTASIMDRNGDNKRTLGIKAKINDIVWQKDNKNFFVALFDPISDRDAIYSYDLETRSLSASILGVDGTVSAFFGRDSGNATSQILAYQANGVIWAVNIGNNNQ